VLKTPSHLRAERGQASVELVGALPVVLLLGAVVWQLALVGHAAWACAHAARAAARAQAVGRDGPRAARSVLPAKLERGMRVQRTGRAGVRVSVRVPLLLPVRRGPVRLSATAALAPSP
jgi:hypothetical protein